MKAYGSKIESCEIILNGESKNLLSYFDNIKTHKNNNSEITKIVLETSIIYSELFDELKKGFAIRINLYCKDRDGEVFKKTEFIDSLKLINLKEEYDCDSPTKFILVCDRKVDKNIGKNHMYFDWYKTSDINKGKVILYYEEKMYYLPMNLGYEIIANVIRDISKNKDTIIYGDCNSFGMGIKIALENLGIKVIQLKREKLDYVQR